MVFTIADQALSSVSNFAVGVAVARLAGVASLGAFTLAYTLWLLLAGWHRALVTDPLIIFADGTPGGSDHLSRGLAAELALGTVAALVAAAAGGAMLLMGQNGFGTALIVLAPWLIPLLVQDFWRWAGFMRRRPDASLANDAVFTSVQALGIVVMLALGHRSFTMAISVWGMGATAGALLGLWQFSIRPSPRDAIGFIARGWNTSRWLLADSSTAWASTHTYVIVAGAILGPAGLGGLRAAQSLMAPAWVLSQAIGSIGLPEASRTFHDRGWLGLRRAARFIAAASALSMGVLAAIVVAIGGQLLRLLYGPAFANYASAAKVFAFGLLVLCLNGPAEVVFKVTRRTSSLFIARMCNMAFSLGAVLVLAPRFGVTGAASAHPVGAISSVVVLAYVYSRAKARFMTEHEVTLSVPATEPFSPSRSA